MEIREKETVDQIVEWLETDKSAMNPGKFGI